MTDRTKIPTVKRWGSYDGGRIHKYIYSEEKGVWHIACREPGWNKWAGMEVNPALPITCESCRRRT